MSPSALDPPSLIEAAEKLVPLLRATAREAELARRPLDEVIDAVRESGLFSLMVPKVHGGHEADVDTFFEVVLTLSRADASMGWLIGFYIEHNWWLAAFPRRFQDELFADRNHALAPGAINVAGGSARRVEGGYRLSGRWQWGTGIVHADWVLAGAMLEGATGDPNPLFFALPREQVSAIDTWFVSGMCATGSWDFEIDDAFVPEDRKVEMAELLDASTEGCRSHAGPLYRTPIMPILGLAAGLPILGAARMALAEYRSQTIERGRALRAGFPSKDTGKPSVAARAALGVDAAELLFRDVLADVMAQRNAATRETRSTWLAKLSHAVFQCREAVQDVASVTGASGGRLDNPIQRALRDVTIASNHVVFDRESRYADYGRLLLDRPLQNRMV